MFSQGSKMKEEFTEMESPSTPITPISSGERVPAVLPVT